MEQEYLNYREHMKDINFNMLKEGLTARTKTQTTRQHDRPRYNVTDSVRLVWERDIEIDIVKITNVIKVKVLRKPDIDYIDGEFACLYPEIKEIARRDGFDSVKGYLDALHKIYNISKEKTFHIYQWKWI